MPDFPTNTDQLDEQLTAYLDGELPPTDARQIEDMLAGDERARKRLNQLASSWDLLDQLPRASVDENFTRTTVEMVALSTEEDIAHAQAAAPSKQRMRWLAAGVIALLAAGVGFFAVSVLAPKRNDALLSDLPVVVNLDLYRPIGSVDLLRKLNKANVFTTDFRPSNPRGWPGGERPGERPSGERFGDRTEGRNETNAPVNSEAEKWIVTVPRTIEERRTWLESNALTAEQKLELRRNFERFSALPAAEQASLRQLDLELSIADDRDQLARIMRRYTDWSRRYLSLAERGALEDSLPEKKLEEIEKRKRDWEAQMFAAPRLGSLLDFVKRNEKKLLENLPKETQDSLAKMKADDRDSRKWRYHNHLAGEVMRHPEAMLPVVTNSDLQPFIDRLPDESRLKHELTATKDLSARVQILSQAVKSGALAQEVFARGRRSDWRWNMDPERQKELESRLNEAQREEIKDLTGAQRLWKVMQLLKIDPRGPRGQFPDGPRRGPDDEPPPDGFRGDGPPDGPRRGGQPRQDGQRGNNGPRRDRNGRIGPPPPDSGPRDNFDRPPFSPPGDEVAPQGPQQKP